MIELTSVTIIQGWFRALNLLAISGIVASGSFGKKSVATLICPFSSLVAPIKVFSLWFTELERYLQYWKREYKPNIGKMSFVF